MLKIYFDSKLIIDWNYISFLSPILWNPTNHIWWEDEDQIKAWTKKWIKLIKLSTSIKDSDVVFFPIYFKLEYFDLVKKKSEEAQKYNKKLVVFYTSDIEDYIDISDNILWLKRSINKFWPKNEYSLPAFPEDLKNKYKKIILNKEKVSVWYTWYSNYYNLKSFIFYNLLQIWRFIFSNKFIKKFLLKIKNEKYYHLLTNLWIWKYVRWKSIKYLKKSKNIKFNYIERRWWLYLDAPETIKKQYIENIVNSNFSLVARWNWNYSFRLYEVLSLWKIPVFIDTNSKLPFEDEIDYKNIFIWVPFNDIKNIEKYINDFLIANKWNLNNIQKEIRKIYEEFFLMENYYTKLITNIIK